MASHPSGQLLSYLFVPNVRLKFAEFSFQVLPCSTFFTPLSPRLSFITVLRLPLHL